MLTNWILPYVCKATLFDRNTTEPSFPSERMWFSSWQSEYPKDFTVLYDRMADSELGEDFETLIDMEKAYRS
jgi:hypothetical protein